MKPPRVVCDVTVFLEAALAPRSTSGALLRRWVERRDFELVITPSLLTHLERLLADPEVADHFGDDGDLQRWVAAVGVLAVVVEPPSIDRGAGASLIDAELLEVAREVGGLVVSSDPQLATGTSESPDVELLSPRALLEFLQAAST